jgi:translation initiation factor 1
MVEIDPITGLPKELSVWENLSKQDQEITVAIDKKKFGKVYTTIKGINDKDIDTKDLMKKLKGKFACGGAMKNGIVELQGDHKLKIKDFLVKEGFAENSIVVR